MNMPLLTTNTIQLATLAGEINQMHDSAEEHANKAIVIAVRLGEKLRQARELASSYGLNDSFTDWLQEYCPRIKRSQAYNYMALTKKMPELLDDNVQTNGRLLSPSQAIALFNADEELVADVMERVESGESVTVAEINRLKKKTEQQDYDLGRLAKANGDLLNEIDALKANKNIDELVRKKAYEETNKMRELLQQDLDRVVAEHEADYQRTIDSLNDTVSKLKNDLGKAQQPEILSSIQKQIVIAEEELERINLRRVAIDADLAYQGLAKHIIEQAANINITLLDLAARYPSTDATVQMMMKAVHDLNEIVGILRTAAQIESFDFAYVDDDLE